MADGGGGEVKNIHREDSTKTLLKNEALYEYMLNTMVYPREHECMRDLRLITQKHTYGFMSSPPDEALLLSMLLKLTGARNTIEVGVFTGCSVLATALAIPEDGRVVAVDVSREYFDLGLPLIQKAGVAHKVDFREGPAQTILDEMLADEGNEGKFDFAFVDADKGSYGAYHEQLLRLVRVGGVLAYDNTLWGGTVAMPDDTPLTAHDREIRDFVRAFNAKVAADRRVEVVQLPVADGITLCRRAVNKEQVSVKSKSSLLYKGQPGGVSCDELLALPAPHRLEPTTRRSRGEAVTERARGSHGGGQRAQRPQLHRQQQQDAAQERGPVPVRAGHHGAAPRAGVHAAAAPRHGQARAGVHAVVPGRGAAAADADQADRRQEDAGGGRVHGLLAPRDGARPPRRRQGRRHRRRPVMLRGGQALHRERRRGPQGGLPRGPRAAAPGRPARRRGQPRRVRLRVRGRGQAQLRQVPRAAAPPGARRRHPRVRQHAVGRHGGAPARRAALRPGPTVLCRYPRPQPQAIRGQARRSVPARHRRRHHHLPPHRLSECARLPRQPAALSPSFFVFCCFQRLGCFPPFESGASDGSVWLSYLCCLNRNNISALNCY